MPPGLGKAIGDPANDDYVAQVLADEARNSSLKYPSLGTQAYMTRRPTGSAPKPNTRFLRHIIKETDNHNTALKRKEEREARERMRQLRAQAPTSERHRHHTHGSDDRDSQRDTRQDDRHRHRSHRERRRSRSISSDRDQARSSRRRHETRERDGDRDRRSRKSHRHRSYTRSRSRSPHGRDSKYRNPDRDRSHRHRSSRRSRSPESSERRKGRRSAQVKNSLSPVPNSRTEAPGDDSDPLEDLVGPLPKEEAPIRSRGRGAYKPNVSNIDAHFAPNYDPTLDVQPEDDDLQPGNKPTRRPVAGLMTGDDDWELALEALRDRARWKQNGEERLREAGFNTDIIDHWKSNASTAAGTDEGRINSVKWSTKSEGREWDRGKYIDEDGHVDVKASW
ncbi:hypothetical protein ASPCAL11009 [Aspergillus calidoustus]|uniref:Pre-mRNA-splicing factor 38B n=1 Tax=Aspergillus calidoustus TaxID=454130 RepID=A0A0U5GDM6_ASPCI|nr:hypothetical protein ASPCAL11009 [Aspergillus calidoustus]